ncbi:uncharacterized protein BDV14DRAFT_185501 [Aspergillus stella-maris]|uniref:uncharacterized protein n=1 Tax=Aspergillus stella-maris TaxID=1810926 RepID=UPI003CCE1069
MTSTRSSGPRRKRKTTALDILNSISNKSNDVLHEDERLTQSARPARQLRNMPRAPRRDIWDIPNSPEPPHDSVTSSSPLAAAEAQTPRRSTRLNNRTDLQDKLVRSSPRINHATVNYQYEDGEGDSKQSQPEGDDDDDSAEDNEGSEAPEEEDYDMMENFNLFSDDDRYPSPAAFQLEQNLEQSGRFESAQSTPHKNATSPRAWSTSPAVVIENGPNKVLETPLAERRQLRIRAVQSPAKDDDGDVDMDESEDMINNGDDNSEQSDDASPGPSSSNSSSGLFVRQDSPDPSSGRSLRPRQQGQPTYGRTLRSHKSQMSTNYRSPSSSQSSEPSRSDGRQSPSQDVSPRPRRSTRRRPSPPVRRSITSSARQLSSGALASRRIRNRSSRVVYNYAPAESPEPESDYPQHKDAMKIGNQEHNWRTLIDEARKIENLANSRSQDDSSMEEYLGDMLQLIERLQQRHESLQEGSDLSSNEQGEYAQQSAKVLDKIKFVGDQILDDVYVIVEEREDEEESRELFDAFEARIIPDLIRLTFAFFDQYHSNPRRYPKAYNLLFRTLNILYGLSDRMLALVKEKYVRTVTRCKSLLLPLQGLKTACKDGLLKNPRSKQSGRDSGAGPVERQQPATWTDAEGEALLAGLQRHTGPGRYAYIRRDFPAVLGTRMLPELQEQARFLHDCIVPEMQYQINAPGGRQQWDWLLSVRI